MFSGIIRHLGKVRSIDGDNLSKVLVISCDKFFKNNQIGDSVAVNGVCLTLIEVSNDHGAFDLSSETLRITALNNLRSNSLVHLESSLKVGDSIDGHFVSGHIDGLTEVLSFSREGETWRFNFSLHERVEAYLVKKGSVTLDGVSLTVGDVDDGQFSVFIIPHTYNQTLFKEYCQGDIVNLEIDPIARYVVNSCSLYQKGLAKEDN